jgi:hypothetical protein
LAGINGGTVLTMRITSQIPIGLKIGDQSPESFHGMFRKSYKLVMLVSTKTLFCMIPYSILTNSVPLLSVYLINYNQIMKFPQINSELKCEGAV